MSDSFVTPWTVAHQAPLSMGFPRQEYWCELPCPTPGDLPDPGIKHASPASAGGFLLLQHQGDPIDTTLPTPEMMVTGFLKEDSLILPMFRTVESGSFIPISLTVAGDQNPVLLESQSEHSGIISCVHE